MIPGHDVKEGAAGSAPPFPGERDRAEQITGPAGMTGGSSYAPLTRRAPTGACTSALCISVTGGPQTDFRRTGCCPACAVPVQSIPEASGHGLSLPAVSSTRGTRISDCDTRTSTRRTVHMPSGCSFLSHIRRTPIHSSCGVFLTRYGYGRGNIPPLLFSRPSLHMMFPRFLHNPFLASQKECSCHAHNDTFSAPAWPGPFF